MSPLFEGQEYEEGEREESLAITTTSCAPIDRRQPLIDYLQHGRLLKDLQKRVDIRRRAPRFLYYNGTLIRRSFGDILLRWLSNAEAAQAMNEAHFRMLADQEGLKVGPINVRNLKRYYP
ncbi:hypothetical protein LIER_31702 [Lithospermum erythrorhizon]|uniref:Uncharacterized protein n=1 Tax=Lithospermum erythrorhizon TaxID=34254 RepID=A0AAV3RVC8_LITER